MKIKKDRANPTSIIIGLVMLLLGIALIFLDCMVTKTPQNLWISIGCSLIASAIIIITNAIFLERKIINPLDKWGIEAIFKIRTDTHPEISTKLLHTKKKLDIIAFGLKSLREAQDPAIDKLLHDGVTIRILTMHPESPFVQQREKEENEIPEQIKKTINDLVEWANEKNSNTKHKGYIEIKGYRCMTLDFYWRMDNDLYVGPYWYGLGSQRTITYKFIKGQAGFETYSEYFNKLWNDSTMETLVSARKRRRRL